MNDGCDVEFEDGSRGRNVRVVSSDEFSCEVERDFKGGGRFREIVEGEVVRDEGTFDGKHLSFLLKQNNIIFFHVCPFLTQIF